MVITVDVQRTGRRSAIVRADLAGLSRFKDLRNQVEGDRPGGPRVSRNLAPMLASRGGDKAISKLRRWASSSSNPVSSGGTRRLSQLPGSRVAQIRSAETVV